MKKLIIIFLVLFTTNIYSQKNETAKHPIEMMLEKCHEDESNHTTLGMMRCEVKATTAWEEEMYKFYDLLMNNLKYLEEKRRLEESQKQWNIYRIREADFIYSMYTNISGTIHGIVGVMRKREIIKQRAVLLKAHYETLITQN